MMHRPRLFFAVSVVLIVLVGTGLRVYRIEAQSLWYDEGNSAAMVGRAPDQITQAAAADIHPPLYYWLLAAWGSLAGKSEMALRLPSALAGIATVAVIYKLGARLFNRTTGGVAALLTALSPFQVYYGQEARMYALLALLSAASILMTIRVLELPGQMAQGRANRPHAIGVVAGYVIVNAAGLYTHYTFPLVIITETVVFFVWVARRKSKLHGLATWSGLQMVTLLVFLPWLPIVIHQFQSWPRLTSGVVDGPTIARTLFYGTTLSQAEAGIAPLAFGLLALISLFPPPVGEPRRYLHWVERIGLPLAWVVVLLAALMSQGVIREPSLKFLLPAQLALSLLVARGTTLGLELAAQRHIRGRRALLPRLVAPLLLIVGVAPMIRGLQNLYFNPAYARDDYRAIAQRIQAEAGPQAAVILDAPNQREVFTYYYPDGPGITPLPDAAPVKAVNRVLAANRRVYAVFWASDEQDPEGKVEAALQRRGYVSATTWYGHVRLATYVMPDIPTAAISHPLDVAYSSPALVKLAGYNLSSQSVHPGDGLGITLFWTTPARLDARLIVFVHLIAPDGTLVAQHDGEPRGGLAPTDTWQPGKLVIDNHGLVIPAGLPPGKYSVRIGLYGEGTADRLPAFRDGQPIGDSVEIEVITVTTR